MKERREKTPHAILVRQIEEVLDSEGPCSLTKITRLVNENLNSDKEYDRDQIGQKIDEMRKNHVISTCFFPGDPPAELKKSDVYYGYFLTRDTQDLIDKGIIGESKMYSIDELARDEDLLTNPRRR